MWRLVRFDQRQIEEWTIPKRKYIGRGSGSFLYLHTGSPSSPVSLHRQAVSATLTEERLRKKKGRCNNSWGKEGAWSKFDDGKKFCLTSSNVFSVRYGPHYTENPIYAFPEMKRAASFPIPTFMYLWAIYIFPGPACLFDCSKIGRQDPGNK